MQLVRGGAENDEIKRLERARYLFGRGIIKKGAGHDRVVSMMADANTGDHYVLAENSAVVGQEEAMVV